ncbi:hypothetical protein GALL_511000 [mine drainage metagenome]|uniref:Uncharacterized protein n=1 Tax=mine drainage metagenome TaxID=410659 RepID=A0A1J5PPV0_9ZZZZ
MAGNLGDGRVVADVGQGTLGFGLVHAPCTDDTDALRTQVNRRCHRC